MLASHLKTLARLAGVTCVALGGLAGCSSGQAESLGTFDVSAERLSACADEGLLSLPESYGLAVMLRRVGEDGLEWRDGAVGLLYGTIKSDGRFRCDQYIQSDMRNGDTSQPACLLTRTLRLEGSFEGPLGQPDGFVANLRYDYAATQGSNCDDLSSGPDGLGTTLPCSIDVEMSATRR